MEHAEETVISVSEEHAKRLGLLAAQRGVTQEILVAEALDRLFRQSDLSNEEIDDVELLRRMEAQYGPSTARTVPSLDPAQLIIHHTHSIIPDLIRRSETER